MPWIDDALEQLAAQPVCGYQPGGSGATEPSALAALALVGLGRSDTAKAVGEFLVELQHPQGHVGVRKGEDKPHWPTSLAMLAWQAIDRQRYRQPIAQAVLWALSVEGERMKTDEASHNTMLAAWPWVEGTHSWVEPSALFTVAFKAVGMADHPRTREAVTLLIDRLLPDGGANYGNTIVLGQTLRPHLQPSGVTLLALAGEKSHDARIRKTLAYLAGSVNNQTSSTSLAWALLGLAAHDRFPSEADAMLSAAYERTMARDKSPHKVALLALAALGNESPIITLQTEASAAK